MIWLLMPADRVMAQIPETLGAPWTVATALCLPWTWMSLLEVAAMAPGDYQFIM